MTWIFGSFLVTPCALTSCHAVKCKQGYDSTIRAVGYNRSVTGRRPRDENCAFRFRERRESQSSEGHAAAQRYLGLQAGDSRRKIWEEEVLFLSICLSIYLSNNNCGSLPRMKWEIFFIKKCVSFVHWISYYHYGYTTK